jgi:hypothetical protein
MPKTDKFMEVLIDVVLTLGFIGVLNILFKGLGG